MAVASFSAAGTYEAAGEAPLMTSAASTWKSAADARIVLTGVRSARYRCVSWAVADSAWEALATPRKAPARATRVRTTPSRTMARWGAYHLQGPRPSVFVPVSTV